MSDMDFLKKAEEKLAAAVENAKIERDSEDTGWMDTEQLLEELKRTAEEILYEKDPVLREKLQSFRKQYQDIYVFFFTDDEFYIYRPITRFEYKELDREYGNDAEKFLEMLVCKAVLYPTMTPERLDGLRAGVAPTLASLIMSASGFGAEKTNPVVKL